MKKVLKICDKCKGTNIKTLVPKLKELDPQLEFDIRCHNLCGIGRTKPFVILNHVPIIADTEEQLILKVKQKLEDS